MWSSSRFALDLLQFVAVDQPLIDRIILMAITQANVQPIMFLPELQRTYATLQALPPEEVRRPVSINALSAMLRIPFETARRHVHLLIAKGVCELVADGARVPASAIGHAEISSGLAAIYELAKAMYAYLHQCDCFIATQSAAALDIDVPPIRAVVRLSLDHALRAIEGATSLTDDLADALLLLTVWLENIDHGEVPASSGRWLLSDAHRLPITAAKLAGKLGISESTVHRRLKKGVRKGWCRISPRGAVIPADFLACQKFVRAMSVNHSNLLRLFNQLSRLGVLEHWDATRKRPARLRRI